MPATCVKQGEKWRVVEPGGSVVKNSEGTPVDGGGHDSENACMSQARAINANDVKNEVIRVSGAITETDGLVSQIEKDARPSLEINSRGGSFFDAVPVYNAIASKEDSEATITGAALSAASYLAMGAKKVRMVDNGLFMMHPPEVGIKGSAKELRGKAEMLDKVRPKIVKAYATKSGKTETEIEELLDAETYLTAEEAKNYGFVDEIIHTGEPVILDLGEVESIPERFRELIVPPIQTPSEGEVTMADSFDVFASELEVDITNLKDDAKGKAILDKVKELKAKVDKPVLAPVVINMTKKYRESKIDGLVNRAEGALITPAVASKLKEQYVKDEVLNSALDHEGNELDGFTVVMEALELNEPVVELNGVRPLEKRSTQEEKDAADMLESMEKLRKARSRN